MSTRQLSNGTTVITAQVSASRTDLNEWKDASITFTAAIPAPGQADRYPDVDVSIEVEGNKRELSFTISPNGDISEVAEIFAYLAGGQLPSSASPVQEAEAEPEPAAEAEAEAEAEAVVRPEPAAGTCDGCGRQLGPEDICYECHDHQTAWNAGVALRAIEDEYGIGREQTGPVWDWIRFEFGGAEFDELYTGELTS